jgi:hypothetical protein
VFLSNTQNDNGYEALKPYVHTCGDSKPGSSVKSKKLVKLLISLQWRMCVTEMYIFQRIETEVTCVFTCIVFQSSVFLPVEE